MISSPSYCFYQVLDVKKNCCILVIKKKKQQQLSFTYNYSEKAMAPHSSTLAWKTPWTEEPGRLQSMGSLDTTERLHFHFLLSCIGEGNGNPLQCSCLENPRDGGAWWAAVCGVTQSQTRLKQLSSSSIQCSVFACEVFNFHYS